VLADELDARFPRAAVPGQALEAGSGWAGRLGCSAARGLSLGGYAGATSGIVNEASRTTPIGARRHVRRLQVQRQHRVQLRIEYEHASTEEGELEPGPSRSSSRRSITSGATGRTRAPASR
jgi:hypothetical protein